MTAPCHIRRGRVVGWRDGRSGVITRSGGDLLRGRRRKGLRPESELITHGKGVNLFQMAMSNCLTPAPTLCAPPIPSIMVWPRCLKSAKNGLVVYWDFESILLISYLC
ncbi:hypothetical protein AVEN_91798-1 [Araneus ventricosus]|uniref:Uncharacterized protein n=1 Tax=Araneus ventricosus TaxID=182803 RepID=A0A4Y2QVS3_ARAVE|nr:hypothetical protein AVEN_91798-1 [Araneus ventricosus]